MQHIHICLNISIYLYISRYIYIYIYECVCVCVNILMHPCSYLYVLPPKKKKTNKHIPIYIYSNYELQTGDKYELSRLRVELHVGMMQLNGKRLRKGKSWYVKSLPRALGPLVVSRVSRRPVWHQAKSRLVRLFNWFLRPTACHGPCVTHDKKKTTKKQELDN